MTAAGSDVRQRRRVIRLAVPYTQAPQRLDRVIPALAEELSRSYCRKLIELGAVHVNGRRVRKCAASAAGGDGIEIYLDGFSLEPFVISAENIIFQDRYLLVIDKPPLVESQPTPARYKGTVYTAALEWLRDPYKPMLRPSLGMVQRLDRDTSGVMLMSIHQRAHKPLSSVFAAHDVVKRYLALVHGVPEPEGEFRSLLARNRATNKMKSVEHGGKEAVTRYRLLHSADEYSLMEVIIPTGRMHQIRVHFAEAGFPLVGDERYGNGADGVPRTMLHAAELIIDHPVEKRRCCFVAPLADDFTAFLTETGFPRHVALSKH